MRSRLSVVFLLIASAAALSGPALSRVEGQTPTFRAGANYVRVDMYATQNGVLVEDLRAEEVDVLEDGVVQKVEMFEHIRVAPAGPQESRIEPNSITASRQAAAEARARVFVVFLDTYHTQIEGSANMRVPLVRFLDRVLGQDDLVAVMTPEMAATDVTFGRKTTVISNIMQQEWAWGRRGRIADDDPKEALYETCFPDAGDSRGVATEMKARRREQMTLDALEDLVIHLGGIREERKAVLTVSEGWRLFTESRTLADVNPRGRTLGLPTGGIGSRGRGRAAGTATGVDMSECDADRVALAMLDNSRRVRDMVEDANRANVSFYPVYPLGLAVFDAPIGPEKPPTIAADFANLNARQSNLRELAENTDGLAVINTNDIEGGLRRIVADLSSYYLLGYYSGNTRLDGRFRNITVRVKRPGVQVRARRGYRGLTADELVAGSDRGGGPAAAPANAVNVVINARAQLRTRTSGWTSTTPAGFAATVWLVGELDAALRKELAWSAGAKAEVSVVAANGTEIVSTSVDIAASEAAFTLRLPSTGVISPGEYAVRVRLRPNADPALPVTDTVRLIVPETPSVLGEAVMWRRGLSTGPRHRVTADPRFQRSDRVRFEFATGAAGTATARMLDRTGKPMQVPVQVTERPDESGAFRWIVADATLAPLAMGDYAIEVTLGDARQVGVFRVVP
jgi:VWFA-related protein